jgi:MFS family permease
MTDVLAVSFLTFLQVNELQFTSEIKFLFRSLRHRNFRLFWIGQLISLIGTWMQSVAQAWLVLNLTHSPFKLGVVTALQFLPILVFSFFTGPFIDSLPKRKIVITGQTVLMLQAFLLAILDWSGAIQYWHVVVLAAILGMVNTIDMPARQSFIIELVGRDDLMNAIALNSSIFNAARALGPALAGLVIASANTGFAFFLNGLSFLAVIGVLLIMRIEERPRSKPLSFDILSETSEAFRYVRNTPVILTTILLVSVVSVFAANFNVLVPVFARIDLGKDAAAFGFLMSSFGFGALIGAATLTVLSRMGPRPSFLYGSGLGLSVFLILIGLQKSYGITALLLALCGWCLVTFFGTANATVQLSSEDHLRGRVMSFYTMAFGGLSPFGSLFAGTVSHWLHAPITFAIGGAITGAFFGVAAFATKKGGSRGERCREKSGN